MNNKRRWCTCTLFLLMLVLNMGCNKEKLSGDMAKDDVLNMTGSNIRLFNLSGMDLPVIINNVVLTKIYQSGNSANDASELGRKIFPEGLWKNRTSFIIPSLLLDKSGRSFISIPGFFQGSKRGDNEIRQFKDTTLQNNPTEPKDYYLLPGGKLVTFNRNSTPPANPQNFKLRIVNLGDAESEFGLAGLVSVTYADGSEVDTKLKNVGLGTSSEYAELPYGAYQFKTFISASDGNIDFRKQLCTEDLIPAYNPCQPETVMPQEGFMPAVTTFKPGGVYTLMVLPSGFAYENNCTFIAESHYCNIYQLVTDLDPGVNFSYARMNAVNTIPGKQVSLTVDGRPMGSALDYIGLKFTGKALPAEYSTFVQGAHTIQATDETGMIAEAAIQLYPFDNYTIWIRSGDDGKATIIFTANDMTNTIYKTGEIPGERPDDGTNGDIRRARYRYAWQSRFMNFCNTQPSITFTNNGQLFLPEYVYPDTVRFQQAYTQLEPGWIPPSGGSIIYTILNIGQYSADGTPQRIGSNDEATIFPLKIWVNSSASADGMAQVPGSLLSSITPITSANTFIANDMMYSSGNARPPAENGVYSIALVGGQSGAEPKIIAIKHNK